MGKSRNKKFKEPVKKISVGLYVVLDDKSGRQVYLGNGVDETEAKRLSDGLKLRTRVEQVGTGHVPAA